MNNLLFQNFSEIRVFYPVIINLYLCQRNYIVGKINEASKEDKDNLNKNIFKCFQIIWNQDTKLWDVYNILLQDEMKWYTKQFNDLLITIRRKHGEYNDRTIENDYELSQL